MLVCQKGRLPELLVRLRAFRKDRQRELTVQVSLLLGYQMDRSLVLLQQVCQKDRVQL